MFIVSQIAPLLFTISEIWGGGTHSVECNQLSLCIWLWCIENMVWLTATHLAAVDNVAAVQESRHFNDSNTEWTLKIRLSKKSKMYWARQMDLFATRNNNRVPKYFSWRQDLGAIWDRCICPNMEL